MNKKKFISNISNFIALMIMLSVCGCNQFNPTHKVHSSDTETTSSFENSYTLDFSEYGFILKAPCQMEDVSAQTSGDFLVNYGGVTDANDPKKMTTYQLLVTRLPIGYKDVAEKELTNKIDGLIKSQMSSMKNVTPINFGYEGYKGYVGETSHNGMKQKGVIFSKDNYIIALTVITNDNLVAKFNKYTNGFKTVSAKNTKQQVSVDDKTVQCLSFGYSVEAPCLLKQYPSQEVDYSYSGATNPDNQDKAIVYKIQASQLPMALSDMISSDINQIKKNLVDYLKSKGTYSACTVNVNRIFAYKVEYKESGFWIKECMILTENHIIELMIFSKQGVSESKFLKFVNSLKKI